MFGKTGVAMLICTCFSGRLSGGESRYGGCQRQGQKQTSCRILETREISEGGRERNGEKGVHPSKRSAKIQITGCLARLLWHHHSPLTSPDGLSAFHLVTGFFTKRHQLKIELKSPVKSLTAFIIGVEKHWPKGQWAFIWNLDKKGKNGGTWWHDNSLWCSFFFLNTLSSKTLVVRINKATF